MTTREDYERAARFKWMETIPMGPGDMLVVTYEGAKYVHYMLAYSAPMIDLNIAPGVLCVPADKRQELHEIVTRRTRRNGGTATKRDPDLARLLDKDQEGG